MAIAPNISSPNMNNNNNQDNNVSNNKELELVDDDQHGLYDMVMPGFRFHPTEEELVEFYLRRKVEGKRFNVELITFLDLYRYDPWELPALAAIGEKEWYFYVPRDKKYRNGDRPNRVTTSGYWKATGADRMIRSENLRSIGLKKTLVFYSGKAPKGIRTSWIMNEYRLPLHETERLQKVEISLCRVYKRAGVDDHPSLPRSLPTTNKASSSSKRFQSNYGKSPKQTNPKNMMINETSPSSSTNISPSNHNSSNFTFNPLIPMVSTINPPLNSLENDHTMLLLQSKQATNNPSFHDATLINDDLHKLVNINNNNNYLSSNNNNLDQNPDLYLNNVPNLLSHFSTLQPAQPHTVALNVGPGSFQVGPTISDRLWDWNGINSEASKDFTNLFK